MQSIGTTVETRALLWSCIKAFLIALLLTPIIRDIFRVYNVVDRPGMRKVHAYPIPRLGGISVVLGYVIGLTGFHSAELNWQLLPGGMLIFTIGILDDFFSLPARLKLLGQIAAGGLAYASGLRAPGPAPISFLATVAWLVLATNAFNLVDGLDGLCAGLGSAAASALFVMGVMQGNVALQCAMLPLLGGLLGFLGFNFSRATMFIGDSGALLIGFLTGSGGLLWTQQTGIHLNMFAPVLVMWVPLTDLLLSIVRRRVAGRPIFSADRGHVHHRLLDLGLSARRAVLLLYACGICGGTMALLLGYLPHQLWQALSLAILVIVTLLGIRRLRYAEFKWPQA